ncbi:MAG TPA: hypothetical protein VHW44_16435 [Pseudonocardiaceae bacterium]|nr:hypothetical protein [Pseudonocardiaceae bacterium]
MTTTVSPVSVRQRSTVVRALPPRSATAVSRRPSAAEAAAEIESTP